MSPIEAAESLLSAPSDIDDDTLDRAESVYNPLRTYHLPKGESKHYQQQYADMYFARLAVLKPAAEKVALEAWAGFEIGGEEVRNVERVLDVRQGELVWVTGTVYMEMPLKPNILDDISKDHWIAAPPPRTKFISPQGKDQIMLEDESGRLRLTGDYLKTTFLVTGCIISVMGTENADGDFEVIDMQIPDLARQPQRWERDEGENAVNGKKVLQERADSGKIALLSGVSISGDQGDTMKLDLLMEYLLGEAATPEEQEQASKISRLIMVGNSLAHASPIPRLDEEVEKVDKDGVVIPSRKYGYDAASYNPAPTDSLDILLSTLLPSLPITLIPGETDPTQTSLPQQPMHAALFPHSRSYMAPPDRVAGEDSEMGWLDSVTNPWQGDVDGWRLLCSGGQNIDDVFKYVEGEERLNIMEAMCRWRLVAPTAPDTLWCYPFQDKDRFVIEDCPHVYVVGNQPRFETGVIEGPNGQSVRLIALPKFRETGELVLVDAETLEPEVVKFQVFDEV